MWFRKKVKRYYALMLKDTNGRLLYQVFDDTGSECDAFPTSYFKKKQEEYPRLTILFTGAYEISEYAFDYMMKQYGWIKL